MTFDTHELAWAAGLFDGEGYCAAQCRERTVKASGRRTYTTLALSISQIHPYVLERFQKAVGFGSILGPYEPHKRQPVYRYSITSFEEVQAAIALMWKWLSPVKRQQTRQALTKWQNRARLPVGRKPTIL